MVIVMTVLQLILCILGSIILAWGIVILVHDIWFYRKHK